MAGVVTQHFSEGSHGLIVLAKDAEESTLCTHDIVDYAIRLISTVCETETVLVLVQRLAEIVSLKLLGSLPRRILTRSSFCLSTLI